MRCPKCSKDILSKNVNGLFYTCNECGHIGDTTLGMIFEIEYFPKDMLILKSEERSLNE